MTTRLLTDRAKFLAPDGAWWIVGRFYALTADERQRASPRERVAWAIPEWCKDLDAGRVMRELYAELAGPSIQSPSTEHVARVLQDAFERGVFMAVRVLQRERYRAPPAPPRVLPPRPRPRNPSKDKHYLDVTVQDSEGNPLAGRRYRLQLPDGLSVHGTLDGSGRIYRGDVPEGTALLYLLQDEGEPVEAEDLAQGTPDAVTQTFSVNLVDELGQGLSGISFTFTGAGPARSASSDDSGVARVDDKVSDSMQVAFASSDDLFAALKDRWDAPRDGDALEDSDTVTVVELHGNLPTLTLQPGVPQTISVQPYVERGRLLGGFFDTSKSFVLPSGLDGVRAIVAMYGDNDGADLLIVGHTDASGSSAYNDALSLERAEALKDLLTQNTAGWLAWYDPAKPDAKRWGAHEDESMIDALPDAGSRDPGESPVRWFRRTRGMTPKDKADRDTRKALIGEYMGLEGVSLPDGITVVTHGCGENFPADPTPDGVADPDNRRVEVFFFDGRLGVQPPPPSKNSTPGSPEYPEWVKRAKMTLEHVPTDPTRKLLRVTVGCGADPDAASGLTLTVEGGSTFPASTAIQDGHSLVFELDPDALPNPCQLLLSNGGALEPFGRPFDPETLRQALLSSDLAASDVVFGPPLPPDDDLIPAPEATRSSPC